MMVCTGIITILGLIYSHWFYDRYAQVSTLGMMCIFGPALCIGGKLCSEETATRQPRRQQPQQPLAPTPVPVSGGKSHPILNSSPTYSHSPHLP